MSEPRIVRLGDGLYGEEYDLGLLPRHLSASAHEGRAAGCQCRPLLDSMRMLRERPTRARGIRRECVDNDHVWRPRWTGWWGPFELRLSECPFCRAVEVRDVSLDIVFDEDVRGRRLYLTPRARARRKDNVLGRYAGTRPSGRVYL